VNNPTRICAIDDCESPSLARGWCSKHWQRWKHHGDPRAEVRRLYVGPPEERFWRYVEKTDDCWLWTGGKDSNGYGRFQLGARHGSRVVLAHRFAYEAVAGPIPDGLGLDHRHTCEKWCVNPEHLRPATQKQNVENHDGRGRGESGIRGVYRNTKSRKAWRTNVNHHGKCYSAGYFDDLEEAAEAVRLLRNRLFTHNEADRMGT